MTSATVGAGLIHFSLRRSQNGHWQALDISRETHSNLKNQKPAVLWFTGLSGAGKSTIADLVEKRLVRMNRHTFLLDGDNVRHALNKDLGFTDAGLIVITAFISLFRSERATVRAMMALGEFVEIFIDTGLEEAGRRDVKGLYKKARAGELKNFTGIDSPYEPPEDAEIQIDTSKLTPEPAADIIVQKLIPERSGTRNAYRHHRAKIASGTAVLRSVFWQVVGQGRRQGVQRIHHPGAARTAPG
jgi:bifunctional enzyme CysN/CysC